MDGQQTISESRGLFEGGGVPSLFLTHEQVQQPATHRSASVRADINESMTITHTAALKVMNKAKGY